MNHQSFVDVEKAFFCHWFLVVPKWGAWVLIILILVNVNGKMTLLVFILV